MHFYWFKALIKIYKNLTLLLQKWIQHNINTIAQFLELKHKYSLYQNINVPTSRTWEIKPGPPTQPWPSLYLTIGPDEIYPATLLRGGPIQPIEAWNATLKIYVSIRQTPNHGECTSPSIYWSSSTFPSPSCVKRRTKWDEEQFPKI